MFHNGAIKQYTTNVIAEAMYSQVDGSGNHYLLLLEIQDHQKSVDAVSMDDKYIMSKNR